MEKTKKKNIDVDSNVNQDIKGNFVAREVKTCFSYEMEAILRASVEGQSNKDYPLPTYEDIQNLYQYQCPECGTGYKKEQEAKECCATKKQLEELEHESLDSEPQEIFEWWIVTEYLYNKLNDKGEPVLEWGNNYYWGRTCTGQAILLDGVISEICLEMEILDGQQYSWADKK